MYVQCTCLPLPSLFVRYAHLTVMISLSRKRGLLLLCSWSCALELTPSFDRTHLVPLFIRSRLLSSVGVSRTGSASDWCALQEALYKCINVMCINYSDDELGNV